MGSPARKPKTSRESATAVVTWILAFFAENWPTFFACLVTALAHPLEYLRDLLA